VEKREADKSRAEETPTIDTVTRLSPFRVSTLVSIAPVNITEDFGVMARHEGDPVPHEHQFYRATLRGLFSLDLQAAGTFSYRNKTGYRNLDDVRVKIALERGLEHLEAEKSYRLPKAERLHRVSALLDGLARLEGGAKQTLHYTDVTPPLVMLAVTKGGNHIFGHTVSANPKGQPMINTGALDEVMTVFADDILSPIYVGWAQGYLDDERSKFATWAKDKDNVHIDHPRKTYQALIKKLEENPNWLD
jgi:CRISPR-associated protein Cst2